MNKFHICITGDLLRPDDNGSNNSRQNGNIQRIYHILRHPIEATSSNISLTTKLGQHNAFELWDAFSSLGLPTAMDSWVKSFDMEDLPEAFLSYIELQFSGYDLIICFEINHLMKRAFDYLGFKYIDILVHPVRFLDDIMFSFYSNDDDIYSLFLRLAVPESIFYREAGFIQSSRVNKKTKLTQYINTVLFGQTDDDKVLIQNGKLVNFSHFSYEIKDELVENDHIGFKPHPYASSDFGILDIGYPLNKLHMVKDNFYHLACSDTVSKIISVTSSVSIEAKYFNKQAVHLGQYPWKFRTETEKSREAYVPLRHEYFHSEFWHEIVYGKVRRDITAGFYSPNKMRLALGNFWGYNEITTDFIVSLYKK